MLQNRLYPQVNKVFLEQLAQRQGYKFEQIEELDYRENDLYKMHKMLARRQQKALYLKDKDTSKWDVKYKTIEEAQAKDKEGNHVLLKDDKMPLEELEKRFPKLKIKTALDELSSDTEDEKSPE